MISVVGEVVDAVLNEQGLKKDVAMNRAKVGSGGPGFIVVEWLICCDMLH